MMSVLLWLVTSLQDDIVLGKKLGVGAFGVVYRGSLAKKPSSKVCSYTSSLWSLWILVLYLVLRA